MIEMLTLCYLTFSLATQEHWKREIVMCEVQWGQYKFFRSTAAFTHDVWHLKLSSDSHLFAIFENSLSKIPNRKRTTYREMSDTTCHIGCRMLNRHDTGTLRGFLYHARNERRTHGRTHGTFAFFTRMLEKKWKYRGFGATPAAGGNPQWNITATKTARMIQQKYPRRRYRYYRTTRNVIHIVLVVFLTITWYSMDPIRTWCRNSCMIGVVVVSSYTRTLRSKPRNGVRCLNQNIQQHTGTSTQQKQSTSLLFAKTTDRTSTDTTASSNQVESFPAAIPSMVRTDVTSVVFVTSAFHGNIWILQLLIMRWSGIWPRIRCWSANRIGRLMYMQCKAQFDMSVRNRSWKSGIVGTLTNGSKGSFKWCKNMWLWWQTWFIKTNIRTSNTDGYYHM